MREQLIKYVQLLFAGTPDSEDMRQEILQNTLDRYDDLIDHGKTPEAAYRLAIAGIGDVGEILGAPSAPAPASAPETADVDYRGRPLPSARKKAMRAVAIGMYICCVVPVIALGNIGDGALGVCLMFLLIAAATVLMVLSSGGSNQENSKKPAANEPRSELYKAIRSVWGSLTLGIYLGISFWSGAWYITWLVFPIMSAIHGIVRAIFDLKEASKHET